MKDSRESKIFDFVRALFWFSCGVAMVVYIGLEGIDAYRVMRGGGQAQARVYETFEDEREYDDGRHVAIVTVAEYEFHVGGTRFTGQVEGSDGFLSKGDNVAVEFNPQNPSQNHAAGDRLVLRYLFTTVMFGGTFAYFAIKLNASTLAELWKDGGDEKPIWLPQLAASGMLLWALNPGNDYGYYTALRWVCCGVFAFLAHHAFNRGMRSWVWILGITAAVYNPFFQVHLTRQYWSVVNIVTIEVAIVSVFVLKLGADLPASTTTLELAEAEADPLAEAEAETAETAEPDFYATKATLPKRRKRPALRPRRKRKQG